MTYTGTILATKGKERITEQALRYSREDIQHRCLSIGIDGRFRGIDEDGRCWTFDTYDGWQLWEATPTVTSTKGVGGISVKELSELLKNKPGKVGLVRSRGVWCLIIGRNEYKGKDLAEVLNKALWDA